MSLKILTSKSPRLTDNIVISFSVADMKSLDHAEVRAALDTLKNHGIVRLETSAGKKRLSDGSNISCGGSSGYLGGSSSGVTSSSGSSSQRSRLSIAPETNVEKHNVIAKLPSNNRINLIKESNDDDVEEIKDKVTETAGSEEENSNLKQEEL